MTARSIHALREATRRAAEGSPSAAATADALAARTEADRARALGFARRFVPEFVEGYRAGYHAARGLSGTEEAVAAEVSLRAVVASGALSTRAERAVNAVTPVARARYVCRRMPSDDDEAARGLVERFPERVETPIRERCGVHAPEQAVVAMVEAALRDAREFERRLAACLALTVTKASAHAKLEAIAAAAGRSSFPGTAPLERPLYLKAVGLAGIPAPFSAEAGWMAFGLKDAADDEEEFVSRMREVWERGRREGLAEARR